MNTRRPLTVVKLIREEGAGNLIYTKQLDSRNQQTGPPPPSPKTIFEMKMMYYV